MHRDFGVVFISLLYIRSGWKESYFHITCETTVCERENFFGKSVNYFFILFYE